MRPPAAAPWPPAPDETGSIAGDNPRAPGHGVVRGPSDSDDRGFRPVVAEGPDDRRRAGSGQRITHRAGPALLDIMYIIGVLWNRWWDRARDSDRPDIPRLPCAGSAWTLPAVALADAAPTSGDAVVFVPPARRWPGGRHDTPCQAPSPSTAEDMARPFAAEGDTVGWCAGDPRSGCDGRPLASHVRAGPGGARLASPCCRVKPARGPAGAPRRSPEVGLRGRTARGHPHRTAGFGTSPTFHG